MTLGGVFVLCEQDHTSLHKRHASVGSGVFCGLTHSQGFLDNCGAAAAQKNTFLDER
jgi:hypothetical protein